MLLAFGRDELLLIRGLVENQWQIVVRIPVGGLTMDHWSIY
jgi:hypothetical protein